MTLTLGELRDLLDERQCGYSDGTVVQAVILPRPGTFEVVYLTGSITTTGFFDSDVVTLHLVEVDA